MVAMQAARGMRPGAWDPQPLAEATLEEWFRSTRGGV
jgi:hypothetical protein